ncbi:MAG: pyruvate kinase [Flavobacteriales bacterium]|nr:pyruvate kinase [Flavobacteriales bacterium]MCB9449604.1 pyruvate kinase [Flavobacteriales bacterium]
MRKIQSKSKIVATVGPASSSREVLEGMVKAGVDVFRLNFSHSSYEEHEKIIKNIRAINEDMGYYIAILADLQGPKLRIGEVENGMVLLQEGRELEMTTDDIVGTAERIGVRYPSFVKDVKVDETVMIDDGKILLKITEKNGQTVKARVLHGGELYPKKGVNLPNTKISLPCLTEKDLKDLEFALKMNVQWIGLSFVRSASDVLELKHIISSHNRKTRVVAKIEKPEAIEDIDNIIKATDAIMVARGDLGVEIPIREVPLIQKEIVRKCLRHSRPVIIATQMMESMIQNIHPTRAEVSDVANSVMDGADALMLSGETSVGKFPVKVIETMQSIITHVEKNSDIYNHEYPPSNDQSETFISDSICYSACKVVQRTGAKAVVGMTHSGYTAFKLSSHRPDANIFVFTDNPGILSMLNLVWGVRGFFYDKEISTDHTIADIKYFLKKHGYVNEGDLIINIASIPLGEKGRTNMMKLSRVD